MIFSRMSLLFLLVFGLSLQVHAQTMYRSYESNDSYRQFCLILLNGEPIVNENTPDGPLRITDGALGKLSVSTIDRSGNKVKPVTPIGFRIAILNGRTNTMWMYSEETLYEVKLQKVLEKCEMGDRLIFMTMDQKYQLPRHEIIGFTGC